MRDVRKEAARLAQGLCALVDRVPSVRLGVLLVIVADISR